MIGDERGQIQTIESFVATFILLAVLVVVVQATSVTPLTTSFTNQHVKYELQSIGQDILASLDSIPCEPPATTLNVSHSQLEMSLADWLAGNFSETTPPTAANAFPCDWYTYDGVSAFVSVSNPLHNHTTKSYLEKALTFAFSESGIAYNVEVRYPDADGTLYSTKMIWNGDPSDNCVTVSRYVALHDQDDVMSPPRSYEIPYADEAGGLIKIPDISTGGPVDPLLHNVVEVRLTVWVM
ncbi:MAG: hypothetical protein A4E28_01761 [Methanocella sp. PtaU1.Bin125]|nr:MAG: hypothetical protein A4E28_01761 [Methanocella sp. PtaU1.Bin125]